ncbi:CD1375 family protein [Clostridium sp. Cult1]|nr:CD1375 family protein [Clostridium sp. Cult1]
MVFTKDSRIVQDYVLLINKGLRTLEDVPDLFNLKEVVEQCLEEQEQ